MRFLIIAIFLFPHFAGAVNMPPLGCIQITETIMYGSTDTKNKNQVSMVQRFLIQRGFLSGSPTGVFNSASMNALKKYQIKSKIADVGITDAKTRERIKKDTCTAIKSVGNKKGTITVSKNSTVKPNATPQEVKITKVTTTIKDLVTGKILGATTTVEQDGKVTGKNILVSSSVSSTKATLMSPVGGEVEKKIQILTPFAGFSVKAGYPTNIMWTSSGYGANEKFRIALINDLERESQLIPVSLTDTLTDLPVSESAVIFTAKSSSLSSNYKNSGIYSWSVPGNLPYGIGYKLFVGPVNDTSAGVFSESFTILGKGMLPVIKNIRTSKVGADTYLVNITGENLRSSLSVRYSLNGREVGQTDASSIKFFNTTQMQYSITREEMEDMPAGVYFDATLFDDEQESSPKNIIFW